MAHLAKWFGTLFFIGMIACAGGAALGADYTLVTGSEFPPYADQKQPDGGLTVRIVRAVFASIGKSITIQVLPWSRGYAMTLDRKFDATFPYATSTARSRDMLVSMPIFTIESRIWSAPDRPIHSYSEAALTGKRFCLPVGYSPPAPLQALIDRKAVTFFMPRSLANCVKMIDSNHADFSAGDTHVFRSVFQDAGIKLVGSDDVLQKRPLALLTAKTNPKGAILIADFDKGLERIEIDGTYAKLIR